ncbi:MAG TPA: ABC transporter permease [Bryobacteraceae bacterium]|nr:ABC transporter permease [Bryobacteraceae bacterium]
MIARRVAGLFRRRSLDARLDEEISTHLDLLSSEYQRQGLSADEARAAARREFGALQQMREVHRDQRSVPLVDSVSQDIRYAVRSLRRRPGFTLAALTILALGIGPNAAVFSVVDAILFRSLPFRDPGRLVEITGGSLHNQASLVMIRDASRLADYASYGDATEANLTGQGEPARIPVSSISGNLLDVLGVMPQRGRSFHRDEEMPGRGNAIILSHALWQERFAGDPGIIGRTIHIDDVVRTVVGVMPADFRFPTAETQAWIPATVDPRNDGYYWWAFSLSLVGRLHAGATPAAARAELKQVIPRIRDAFPWKMWPDWAADSNVVPLQESLTAGTRRRLLILFGSVLLVLLIACCNLATLMLSRGLARQREIATRTALGAGRWRILRQLFTEGLLLSFMGALIGIALAFAVQSILTRVLPANTPRVNEIAINARVLLFTAVAAVLSTVVFSIAPAVLLTRSSLHHSIHSAARVTGGRTSSALVTVEIALAVVLVCAAALMGRSLWTMSGIATGIRADHLLTARISPNGSTCHAFGSCVGFYADLLNRTRTLPGVQTAAAANTLPLATAYSAFAAELENHPLLPGHEADMLWVTSITPDYLAAMGIPILRGRGFTDLDAAGSEQVILVSASTAARWWPGQDPIGKHIRATWLKKSRRVIGVVPDIQATPIGQRYGPIQGQTWIPYAQPIDGAPAPEMTVVLRTTRDPLTYAAELRRQVRALSADVPITDVQTMEEVVRGSLATPRSTLWLLFSFAALALALGVAGIYGVVSWNVSRRVPEIGVRIAMGATPAAVCRMVLSQTVRMACVGIVIGIGGALAASRLLHSLLFGVSPHDPLTYVAGAAILFGTGLLAGYMPSRRAARIDPVSALRFD